MFACRVEMNNVPSAEILLLACKRRQDAAATTGGRALAGGRGSCRASLLVFCRRPAEPRQTGSQGASPSRRGLSERAWTPCRVDRSVYRAVRAAAPVGRVFENLTEWLIRLVVEKFVPFLESLPNK